MTEQGLKGDLVEAFLKTSSGRCVEFSVALAPVPQSLWSAFYSASEGVNSPSASCDASEGVGSPSACCPSASVLLQRLGRRGLSECFP